MYAIVYIDTTNKQIYPMAKKYIKKEKVLVLKHDVILGSTYELVDVETDVTQYMSGGESMTYEASVVIPIGKPDVHGDVMTQEAVDKMIASNNTNPNDFPIIINGHTIGHENVAVVKKDKSIGKNKA
jgi:hypothetical protein